MPSNGPNYGNGKLKALEIKGPLTFTDTTMPCLALQWNPQPFRGEKQNVQRADATIELAIGTGVLVATLTVGRRNFQGAALPNLTYVITGAAAKVDWSDTDFTASQTASANTLKDLIDLINQIDGFKAWALHAPHSLTLDNNDFIALAATGISSGVGLEGRSEVIYRDVSELSVAYLRVGLPEERDRNAFELFDIQGTAAGVTNGTVKLYRDDYSEYGETPEQYVNETLLAAQTSYLNYDRENAPTVRGPVLLEIDSDDLTACEMRLHLRQATMGM